MDTTRELLGLAEACDDNGEVARILEAALPFLLRISQADSVAVLAHGAFGIALSAPEGTTLDDAAVTEVGDLLPGGSPGALVTSPVPDAWAAGGVRHVAAQRLPGQLGVLVLAWPTPDVKVAPALEVALTLLHTALARRQAEEELADIVARVDNAQLLADMGDYDWHIPTDTNRWSDQLFRIYGHEPQSFNPSYERFVSMLHPDDRERITQLHQASYASGEPYQMIERVVRPDGEVRHLSSNGEVLMDSLGTPIRMRGTCIDITDRVLAEQEREHIAARFRGLVESAPEAILVLDDEGRILESNPMAHELLGGTPTGHLITELLPDAAPVGGTGVDARGLDGRALLLDVTRAAVDHVDTERLVALFLRDATERLRGEALATSLMEARLRRRQALEINDNVVQGLAAASYALDEEQLPVTAQYLQNTLSAAREMMDDLLDPLDSEALGAGDLVRTGPAETGMSGHSAARHVEPPAASAESGGRVLVVDDAEDLRMLLRLRIDTSATMTVVGEAADGVEAVEQARELQPDLVLLDLAMPRMDGLEALPLIRDAVPGVRVIVLSGFDRGSMAERALAAGADHYVVKGGPMRELITLAESVLQARA